MTDEQIDGYEPIAVATRSGAVESVHHGALVALDSDGSVAFTIGDPPRAVYPRSSLKPLQATAMVGLGLDVDPQLLAVACASHDGLPMHVAAVRRLLAVAGLDESALANTPDWPLDAAETERVIRDGGSRAPIRMNCSGKHAAMLATAVLCGWPHDPTYLDRHHPLQEAILGTLQELTAAPIDHVGVDGCGAPTHMVSLTDLASAFVTVATAPEGSPGHAVHRAMTTHPELVGGPTRDVTVLMRAVSGLMVKDGAQGVCAAALPDGRAVALKVADGGDRPRAPLMAAALAALGVDLTALAPGALHVAVLGHGREVGEVRVVGRLAAHQVDRP